MCVKDISKDLIKVFKTNVQFDTGFEKVESESLPLATSQQPALHPAPTAAVAVLPQQHQQQQQQPPVSQCQHNITQLSIQPHSSLQVK